jgi:hypothetical protein
MVTSGEKMIIVGFAKNGHMYWLSIHAEFKILICLSTLNILMQN